MTTGKRLLDKVTPFAAKMDGIGHPFRLAIIYLLCDDPKEVRDLVIALNIKENLLAHHLKYLHLTGWVMRTKQGRTVTYRLNEKAFFELNKLLGDTPFWRQNLAKYYK